MTLPAIPPLAQVPIDPMIAALPKADLHLHQEAAARLERLAARRQGRPPYDRHGWAARLMAERPPGMGRLGGIYDPDDGLDLTGVQPGHREIFVARVVDDLVRMREAESRLEMILEAVPFGLGGVDFSTDPYDTELDPAVWAVIYRWAERAATAGLGITVHAGEFSPANLAAALGIPGLGRVGHAVYAAADPRLLDRLARSGATVECSLTSNVILGAVPSYEAHPIRRFVEHGIPVTLSSDLPVHACTTIGREYAIAAALGFSPAELLAFTRNAVVASFASSDRRSALLTELNGWADGAPRRSDCDGGEDQRAGVH